MTTTTDTLTRWTVLWEQDDGLRPEFDGWKLVMWGREWSWICNSIYKDAPVGLVAMAIRDSAVRWLAEKGLQPTIDNEHPLGNPWAVVLADEMSCGLAAPCGGDTLDDALYAACTAVLGEEKT